MGTEGRIEKGHGDFTPDHRRVTQNVKYVDRDGNQRTSTILVASSFEFVPTAKRDGGNAGCATDNDASVETAMGNETENDIPF